MAIQLQVRVVTPRAVARVAPTQPAADRERRATAIRFFVIASACLLWPAAPVVLASNPLAITAAFEEPLEQCRWAIEVRESGRVSFNERNCKVDHATVRTVVSTEDLGRIRLALQDAQFCGLRPEYTAVWPDGVDAVVLDAETRTIAAPCGSGKTSVRMEGAERIANPPAGFPPHPGQEAARRFLKVWEVVCSVVAHEGGLPTASPNRTLQPAGPVAPAAERGR